MILCFLQGTVQITQKSAEPGMVWINRKTGANRVGKYTFNVRHKWCLLSSKINEITNFFLEMCCRKKILYIVFINVSCVRFCICKDYFMAKFRF